MKNALGRVFLLMAALCLTVKAAAAPSPVTLTIDGTAPAKPIPADFSGLSFETGSLRYNHYRTNAWFFDSTDAPLLMMFKNLGVTGLRIGGNSVEGFAPSHEDIDALFRFVKAAHLKVVYSLRLANGDPNQDAEAAQYVWDHYAPYLICLAIGNEPNSYNNRDPEITNAPTFIAKWNRFAAVVRAAVPDAVLGGPDSGNGGTAWTATFAQSQQGVHDVGCVLAHYEPGGWSVGKTPQQIIDEMLSPACDDRRYPDCYTKIGLLAHSLGLSFRFTEANSHVATPATQGGNHTFATALFALDLLHWWAAHDCQGVHFHTGLGGFNGAFIPEVGGGYEPHPIGYGIAAFNAGGRGSADSMSIHNPGQLNLTAYAVTDTNHDLFVTIINREHGAGARDAAVSVNVSGGSASVIYLQAASHDVTATNGVTLAGASINGDSPWQGQWTPLGIDPATGPAIQVAAASAAIVRFTGAKIVAHGK